MWGIGKGGNEKCIGYAVNDMDNTISEIDYNDPMTFFDIEKVMGKVISKELKSNSLKLNKNNTCAIYDKHIHLDIYGNL